jgi:benzoyl-CoA-dihydrodiol lyase
VGSPISFATRPGSWRHWKLEVDEPIARLQLAIDPERGLRPDDYKLKLNSYDLGVDIELHDAVERLRLEYPGVRSVVIGSDLDRVFCSGANIPMLATSTHVDKINFCRFTNETRFAIEDASAHSGQTYIAALAGTTAGGGYELALACHHLILVDDKSSAVSLPEIPLLGVLPGTGGLTRVVDKRKVRRDHADLLATTAEGIMGQTALDWNLVDELAPRSTFDEAVTARAQAFTQASPRPAGAVGFALEDIDPPAGTDTFDLGWVNVAIERKAGYATVTIVGPDEPPPDDLIEANGGWLLEAARQLDRTLLHLRFNEVEIGQLILKTVGDPTLVAAWDARLIGTDWAATELRLLWKRTLQRLEQSARSLLAVVEPGSCFVGALFELVVAADRSWMLDGTFEDLDDPLPAATVRLTATNTAIPAALPMLSGQSRLFSHFSGNTEAVATAAAAVNIDLDAAAASRCGLVTSTPDDLDWEDELRIAIEERASFNPDALTGMEATLRFVGAENCDTKTLGRLTAWQNWIFHRDNASGPEGGLRTFGTGRRPSYDPNRT